MLHITISLGSVNNNTQVGVIGTTLCARISEQLTNDRFLWASVVPIASATTGGT